VIPTAFAYERADSIDEALAKLAAARGAGKLIAGGHSLVPLMKLRLSEPAVLIDIGRIPGLVGIRESGGKIEIGAGTVHHAVASSDLLQRVCPVVAESAAEIGDPQVRHRGTLGGSLAHSDPAADYPAAMLAIDAEIHIKGPKAGRIVKASDFFQGLFTVDLAADEIIVAVQFPPTRAAAYAKLRQRASHFAIVGVAAALDVAQGVIRAARVAVTGASTHASRLEAVEAALRGQVASPATFEAAAERADADLTDVNSDIHASDSYRRAMVRVFTRRALERALMRA
jgi:carbon-monoxide dehydrogenase medium subunit